MFYYSIFWGMNLIWWAVWSVMLLWIFALPFNIPGQRNKKDSPLDILQKKFASGHITTAEYLEKRDIIENKLPHKKRRVVKSTF